MRVLFVSSGNFKQDGSPIVLAQGESLKNQNIQVDYYIIIGKGFWGYCKNIISLRKVLNKAEYDILHAHYGLTAIVALIGKKKQKLVVSFMGDDLVGSNKIDGSVTFQSLLFIKINAFLARFIYHYSIVKTEEMFRNLKTGTNSSVVPNGVDTSVFYLEDKRLARELLGLDKNKRIVIFVSNPNRAEKNYSLALKSIEIVNNTEVLLIPVYDQKYEMLRHYYNAADVLVLTSYHEGSPNVIKEAMACSCPIVSTDVGDVKWVIGETEGCYLTSFRSKDVADKLNLALRYSETRNRTMGRERIFEQDLDSKTVAKKIIDIYNGVLD